MYQSCRTPHDVVHLLRHRYGLPVELAERRPVLVCGGRVEAVDMPADLGCRVLSRLDCQQSVPVVADPRGAVWTFLAAPPFMAISPDRHRDLATRGARVRPRDRLMILPMSDREFGWHWASPPRPGPLLLPALREVLDAAVESPPRTDPSPARFSVAYSPTSPHATNRSTGLSHSP